jgi:hypothetical protein
MKSATASSSSQMPAVFAAGLRCARYRVPGQYGCRPSSAGLARSSAPALDIHGYAAIAKALRQVRHPSESVCVTFRSRSPPRCCDEMPVEPLFRPEARNRQSLPTCVLCTSPRVSSSAVFSDEFAIGRRLATICERLYALEEKSTVAVALAPT